MPSGSVTAARLTWELACLVNGWSFSAAVGTSNGDPDVDGGSAGRVGLAGVRRRPRSTGRRGSTPHSFGEVPGGILDSKNEEPSGKLGSGIW